MRTTTAFVDLEETLVDNFDELVPINHVRVAAFLDEHCPTREVELFSFAVWEDRERERLQKFAGHIEQAHDLKLVRVWTCEEMIKLVQAHTGVVWDLHDFLSVWGKERAFEDFALALKKQDHKFVLLDDVVANKSVHFSDTNVTVQFVRC